MRLKEFLNENSALADFAASSGWDQKFSHIKQFFAQAKDAKDVTRLKKEAHKRMDAREEGWKAGPIDYFSGLKRKEFKRDNGSSLNTSAKDIRTDRILRTRDSSGRAKARKFS